jgi:bifunctional UDP-N-acetylglucosamine pyrophosphorylase/glucosamine-1-phosphate N-acetyltransferase
MPAVRASTLKNLVDTQRENTQGPITMLTVTVDDPRGFGRVVRDGQGAVAAVVEDADANPAQREIRELNAGMYCFDTEWLWNALENLSLSPQGEYYLTDLIAAAVDDNLTVSTVPAEDQQDLIGINNRVHLAEAAKILQRRINEKWMMDGVSIPDPNSVYISPDVQVGQDTVILPHTHLRGKTKIGQGCKIGPNTIVVESTIGNSCEILSSVVEFAVVEDQVDIGPFGHLRKGAHLAEGVHLGNFGEVKDSYLGAGTKMGHFSYIGNAKIGKDVNIGAGTITCNYDGKKKHQTVIEDNVFVGSDTMLVAPVHLGKNARTGAGSVVTRDIPEDSLAVGVPARIRKPARENEADGQEEKVPEQ